MKMHCLLQILIVSRSQGHVDTGECLYQALRPGRCNTFVEYEFAAHDLLMLNTGSGCCSKLGGASCLSLQCRRSLPLLCVNLFTIMIQLTTWDAVEGVTFVTVEEIAVPEAAFGRTAILVEKDSMSAEHLNVRDTGWRLDDHSITTSAEAGVSALFKEFSLVIVKDRGLDRILPRGCCHGESSQAEVFSSHGHGRSHA